MEKLALLAVLFLVLPATHAATISGTAFEWFTLEPRGNTILEIDTIPRQTLVSGSGEYSFTVGDGNYTLKAYYFEGNTLRYYAEEEIFVGGDGNFNVDLLMFPPLEDIDLLLGDFTELNSLLETEAEPLPESELDFGLVFGGIMLVLVAFSLIFFAARKITKSATGLDSESMTVEKKIGAERDFFRGDGKGTHEEKGSNAMDPELAETLEILRRYGGRMTQKELRGKVPYGEAKVSLIVAELEEMGKIKKFRKGRGNIIVLKE